MNTLTEYGYLSTDMMKKGIALTIVKDCPFMERLPYMEISGNSLLYNLESVAAGAQFYQTGDTWVESSPVWAQRSATLTILGGDADVDNFAAQTRSNVNDLKAEVLALKAKAIQQQFMKQLILGQTSSTPEPNAFKGLVKLLAECEAVAKGDLDGLVNTQVMPAHATSATLTLQMLDQLIDYVKGGKPTLLLMSKRMLRKLSSLCRAGGANMTFVSSALGEQIAMYSGIPVMTDDYIPDNIYNNDGSSVIDMDAYVQTTTRTADYDNSLIFALTLGPDALMGLTNGWITTKDLGDLETKDASRTRIKFYCAMALFNTTKCAVMTGVTDGL